MRKTALHAAIVAALAGGAVTARRSLGRRTKGSKKSSSRRPAANKTCRTCHSPSSRIRARCSSARASRTWKTSRPSCRTSSSPATWAAPTRHRSRCAAFRTSAPTSTASGRYRTTACCSASSSSSIASKCCAARRARCTAATRRAARFGSTPSRRSTEYGVQVDMTVGNLDRRDVKGSLDLPITENFRSRFTLASYDRDGYITSLTTGQKSGAFEDDVGPRRLHLGAVGPRELRFNAQSDEIVDTQARVNTYIDNQIGCNSGFEVGLSLAYDIASGGRWNCNYTCSGFPGGQLGKWEGRQDITVPSREWLEQQTVDLKVDITDNIELPVPRGSHVQRHASVQRLGRRRVQLLHRLLPERARPHEPRVPVHGRQRSVSAGSAAPTCGIRGPRAQPGLFDGRLGRGNARLPQRGAAVLVCELRYCRTRPAPR